MNHTLHLELHDPWVEPPTLLAGLDPAFWQEMVAWRARWQQEHQDCYLASLPQSWRQRVAEQFETLEEAERCQAGLLELPPHWVQASRLDVLRGLGPSLEREGLVPYDAQDPLPPRGVDLASLTLVHTTCGTLLLEGDPVTFEVLVTRRVLYVQELLLDASGESLTPGLKGGVEPRGTFLGVAIEDAQRWVMPAAALGRLYRLRLPEGSRLDPGLED